MRGRGEGCFKELFRYAIIQVLPRLKQGQNVLSNFFYRLSYFWNLPTTENRIKRRVHVQQRDSKPLNSKERSAKPKWHARDYWQHEREVADEKRRIHSQCCGDGLLETFHIESVSWCFVSWTIILDLQLKSPQTAKDDDIWNGGDSYAHDNSKDLE